MEKTDQESQWRWFPDPKGTPIRVTKCAEERCRCTHHLVRIQCELRWPALMTAAQSVLSGAETVIQAADVPRSADAGLYLPSSLVQQTWDPILALLYFVYSFNNV